MKKVSFALLFAFGFFFVPIFSQASVPALSSCTFNDAADATFNPNSATVSIAITADQPVKFNTIAICSAADTTCSRTTASKYFTNTSAYSSSVSKNWDGKTGGSSPTLVAAGSYRVRVTVANQSGEANSPGDFCSGSIIVDYSAAPPIGSDTATSTDSGTGSTATSTSATSTQTTTTTIQYFGSYSSHSDPNDLSSVSSAPEFSVGAGRERLVLAGSPIEFRANMKGSGSPEYSWSFGDGSASASADVSHIYYFPGDYNVVLNAGAGSSHSTARTRVRVVEPDFTLASVAAGGVRISNSAGYEANISGWELAGGSVRFKIPRDTIIAARGSVVLPSAVTGIPSVVEPKLFNPLGILVAFEPVAITSTTAQPSVLPSVAVATSSPATPLAVETASSSEVAFLRSEIMRMEDSVAVKEIEAASPPQEKAAVTAQTEKSKATSTLALAAVAESVSKGRGFWQGITDFLRDFF